ncbi:MAG: YhdP family protein [Wenzhouxiangella sp.]
MSEPGPERAGLPRRLLRQLRGLLLAVLTVLVIVLAIVVGVGRALMPQVDELRPWLVEQASERLGMPVAIERLEGQWPRLTPRLTLHGLTVGEPDQPLIELDQARLDLHLPNLLRPARNPFQLVVLGLDILLVQQEDGQWGFELGGGRVADRGLLDSLPILDWQIRDASVRVQPARGPAFSARLVEGSYRRSGPRSLLEGELVPLTDLPVERDADSLNLALLLEHPASGWQRLQARLQADSLNVADWLDTAGWTEDLGVALEASLDWQVNGTARLDLDMALDGLDSQGRLVRTQWIAERHGRQSAVELRHLALDGVDQPLISGLALGRAGQSWAAAVDHLDLGRVFELAQPWLAWLPWLPEPVDHLSGQLEAVSVGWRDGGYLHQLEGRLTDLAWRVPDRFPSVSGLSLTLGRDGDRAEIQPGGAVLIDWLGLLRGPVQLDDLSGRLLVGPGHIEVDNLALEKPTLSASAHGAVYFDGQPRPFLDLLIEAKRIEGIDPRPFLPPRYMPATAIGWMDASVPEVTSASGHALLHLRAGTRSADMRPELFQAEAAFESQRLDYWPDWPAGERLAGQVRFAGRSLEGQVASGQLGTLDVRVPDFRIADLTSPVMRMAVETDKAPAAGLAGLLASLPVEGWSAALEPLEWSGETSVDLALVLPFSDMASWDLAGQGELHGVDLSIPQVALRLAGLGGVVEFDRRQLGPARLTLDGPGQAEMTVSADFDAPARLAADARLDPLSLIDWASLGLAPGRVSGGQARLDLGINGQPAGGVRIELTSDLTGLALDLPPPLTKAASEAWPLLMAVELGGATSSGQVNLAEAARLRWLASDDQGYRVGLALNDSDVGLPEQPGWRVRGQISELPVADWVERLAAVRTDPVAPTIDAGPDLDLAVTVGRLTGFGLQLDSLPLRLERRPQDWLLGFEGEQLAGQITIPQPLDSGRVLAIDLSRLYLAPLVSSDAPPDLMQHPASQQTSSMDPRGLPPLSVLVEDLRWGEIVLGRARAQSHAGPDGMEIELFDISGDDLRLNGRGRWQLIDDRIQSSFQGRLTTQGLSGLLESAGYDSGIEASRARVDADVRWPGAPQDFSLARLSGELDLRISEGSIPEARPGAGRLLGLVSFTAIPRRLMLDFRDVFGAGLQFDSIEGRFDLASGFARTDGLRIETSAARITVSGDTDMAARLYDQTVLIEPGLGATLPVIGVLAGGPVGAAAGLVLRQILDRPLRGIAEARYSVTGPWDDPLIELVEARVTDEQGDETLIRPETDDGPELDWEPEPSSDP